ncbi:hypothetical protein RSSM_02648 [Rhodopirellula sallentina SM41]|uniref:Uncharacterized protein n=1 Tax=Rhodopirellula sallentina SM41 TaxID=1263870 RepID=M5UIP9_9BACT|nr:hypothetical protein RSSM_02648 [Rhodopirellula sallentina SM41]
MRRCIVNHGRDGIGLDEENGLSVTRSKRIWWLLKMQTIVSMH